MICWICRVNEADSGEHLIQASDLKLHFQGVTQNAPLYFHREDRFNKFIQSINSDHLKSKTICKKCNNDFTQNHDLAWGELSKYIKSHWDYLNLKNEIYLKRVFDDAYRKKALYVHLFFLKKFGCLLCETPYIDFKNELSDSILHCKAHPYIFIEFTKSKKYGGGIGYSRLEVETVQNTDRLGYAAWLYCIENIWVRVFYLHPDRFNLDPVKFKLIKQIGWNPRQRTRIVKLITP